MVSILALCNETSFGAHYVSTGILLYKTVFLFAMLFNSESWTRLTQTDIKHLQTLQLKTLKRITHVGDNAPNSFMFLELGIIPITHELHRRKLTYLYHIANLNTDNPVNKVYTQQDTFLPQEKNWTNEVKELIQIYNLQNIDPTKVSESAWKSTVTSAVKSKAFNDLVSKSSQLKKTTTLQYERLQTQAYIKTLPAYITTLLLRIRSNTVPCKAN